MSIAARSVGLGYRHALHADILSAPQAFDFLEIMSEDFMAASGRVADVLELLVGSFPVICHGTCLSLGGGDPLDAAYLARLRELTSRVRAPWFSDHVCFARADGRFFHGLFPLPRTTRVAAYVADRIRRAQDAVGMPIAVENITVYEEHAGDAIAHGAFLAEVLHRSGAHLLLDVTNLHVNATNLGFDPLAFLDELPLDRVLQIHLAGAKRTRERVLDTHDRRVSPAVHRLYARCLEKIGRAVPTLIEWDDRLPPIATLAAEAERARAVLRRMPTASVDPVPCRARAEARDVVPRVLERELDRRATTLSARSDLYGQMTAARFDETIAAVFERTLAAIERSRRGALLSDYLQAHPLGSWELHRYADDFPAFLAREGLATEVVDIARLELAELAAFHDPADERSAGVAHGELVLNPTARVVRLHDGARQLVVRDPIRRLPKVRELDAETERLVGRLSRPARAEQLTPKERVRVRDLVRAGFVLSGTR
jgi:uncharacterized protein